MAIQTMYYRKEIDGLRAFAVISIIFFHAGFEGFSGGYVGVDIFFVISGYLITRIILQEMEAGTFTLTSFYERRARRILPALLFVAFACIPFAWLWMSPHLIKEFAQSILAVTAFSANIFFWFKSGYFATDSQIVPLLHTWSLAVEEQYYLFFPIFMILSWRLERRWLICIISATTLASFSLAEWNWSFQFPSNSFHIPEQLWESLMIGLATLIQFDSSYYLIPSRAWELLIGVLVAFYLYQNTQSNKVNWAKQLASAIGFILIVYSILFFDKNTPFPGVYALVPTIGTALIIVFTTQNTFIGKLFSLRVFVGLGLISYSTYLWHYPIFAFARMRALEDLIPSDFIVLIAGTIVLAYLSWRYIEQPFRNKQKISLKKILGGTCFAAIFFITFSLITHNSKVFLSLRYDKAQIVRYQKAFLAIEGLYHITDDGACKFHTELVNSTIFIKRFKGCTKQFGSAVLVVGDSHGTNLFNAFSANSSNPFIVGITKNNPVTAVPNENHYNSVKNFVVKYKNHIDAVVFTKHGGRYLTTLRLPIKEQKILDEINYLTALSSHVKVIWLGPQDTIQYGAMKMLYMASHGVQINVPDQETTNSYIATLDKRIDKLIIGSPVTFKSKRRLIDFNYERDFFMEGEYTYSDNQHWSPFGEKYYGKMLLKDPDINKLLN